MPAAAAAGRWRSGPAERLQLPAAKELQLVWLRVRLLMRMWMRLQEREPAPQQA
jgi:hypothetical protein